MSLEKKSLADRIAKTPPEAKDLEEVVLGALMLEAGAVDTAAEILRPEMFYLDVHQCVYRAILGIAQRSQPIDIFTVVNALKTTGELERVGGAYTVTKLTNSVVSAANLEAHCRIILQKFIQREMIRIGGEIVGMGYDDSVDVFEALDEAEKGVLEIGVRHIGTGSLSIGDCLKEAVGSIEEWRKWDTAITGIPCGLSSLDRVTRGWQNTDLVVLAARPAVGKTALALKFAREAARTAPGMFFSLEMSRLQLVLRLLASESRIFLHHLQTGKLDDQQMKHLYREGVGKLAGLGIYLDDSPGLRLRSLRAKARRGKKKHKIGWVIVDYAQLMEGDQEEKNREREVAKISRGLKHLAKELNIPVIALSQLNRGIEQRQGKRREPLLSDLRESGAIEQDADLVLMMWGPEEEDIEQNAELLRRRYLKIAKNRHGMLTKIDLEFEGEYQAISEADQTMQKEPSTATWKPVNLPYKDND